MQKPFHMRRGHWQRWVLTLSDRRGNARIEGADHSLRVRKSSGRTDAEVHCFPRPALAASLGGAVCASISDGAADRTGSTGNPHTPVQFNSTVDAKRVQDRVTEGAMRSPSL